jgi:hypothetical protein
MYSFVWNTSSFLFYWPQAYPGEHRWSSFPKAFFFLLKKQCRSYFMFHGLDANNPQPLFKYLPVLSFTESYIYQVCLLKCATQFILMLWFIHWTNSILIVQLDASNEDCLHLVPDNSTSSKVDIWFGHLIKYDTEINKAYCVLIYIPLVLFPISYTWHGLVQNWINRRDIKKLGVSDIYSMCTFNNLFTIQVLERKKEAFNETSLSKMIDPLDDLLQSRGLITERLELCSLCTCTAVRYSPVL